ncbi:MAG: DUF6585 family protein [Chloroflexota bacterium]
MTQNESLGEQLLEIYPGRRFFIFMLAGGLLLSLCGLLNLITNFSQSTGRADAVVGAVFIIAGLAALNWGYRKTQKNQTSLTAYEDGVVKVRNGKQTMIRWNDVPFLFRTEVSMEQNKTRGFGRHLRTLTTWRLLDVHQTEISLESFGQLGQIAEEKIYPRLEREMVEKLAGGETAVFGPVSVTHEFIQHQDEQFTWADIISIEFDRHLILHLPKERQRNWRTAYVTHIPNMPLLQQFIDEKLGAFTPAEDLDDDEFSG